MKVLLKAPWFAPSEAINRSKDLNLPHSGAYYPKGEHSIPNALKPYLPKTAKILDEEAPVLEKVKISSKSLRDFDEARAASDAFSEVANKAGKK